MPGLDSLAFAFVALNASLNPAPPEPVKSIRVKEEFMKGAVHNFDRVLVSSSGEDLAAPKISPKGEWAFTRVSNVYCRSFSDESFAARFRVFSTSEEKQLKLGHPSGKYLGRLWDLMRSKLSADHADNYRNRTIDVFLSEKGIAGGEQMLARDPFEKDGFGKEPLAMMIYIYQVDKWVRPIDRVRELAHEYGQALLPAPGGYPMPEPWTNGILGESLFLTWLREGLGTGTIKPEDAFGISTGELDEYLSQKVTPKLRSAAQKGPQTEFLRTKTLAAFDAYIGLNMWAQAILPKTAFSKGLKLGTDKDDPGQLPKGFVEGAGEQKEWEMKAPAWAGKAPIWIPLGKGTVAGGKVLKKDASGWALIQPTAGLLKISNPPIDP